MNMDPAAAAQAHGWQQPIDPRRLLASVISHVRSYLDITPDEESFIYAVLAVAASTELVGEEPLWLMLIAPPSSGKSEAIRLLDEVADKRVDELTRAGLLSWSTGGKKAKSVGVLRQIPANALLTVSDFSTVATGGDRDARARMYGMLRVVYDGRVCRGIGGEPTRDGGTDALEWEGRLTMIAGATPQIDDVSSFEGALGERWVNLRLPESSPARAAKRARSVVQRKDVSANRKAAQSAARALVLAARHRIPDRIPVEYEEDLVNLATFVAHARTGVQHEGTGKYRVVLGVPTPEEPMRLVGQFSRFFRSALAIGLDERSALALTTKLAFDCVPLARMRALRVVMGKGLDGATVADVHRGLIRGNRWAAKWELDALEAIGVVEVVGLSAEDDPSATRYYRIAPDYREVCESVASSHSLSLRDGSESQPREQVGNGFAHPPRDPLELIPAPAPRHPGAYDRNA